jgi:uncharacterized protein (TIGR03382 family)
MNATTPLGALLTLAATAPALADFDLIIDQPHDFINGLASEHGTTVPDARTADDLDLSLLTYFNRLTVWMIVSFPTSPGDFKVELYGNDVDRPGGFDEDFEAMSAVDLGMWNDNQNLHLIEIIFEEPSFILNVGKWWISPVALGNRQGNDRGFWGTSGTGDINGFEGHLRSDFFGYPDWTPVSDPGIFGSPSDFAFRFEGNFKPAPGTLAVLGLGALSGRCRRRRQA